MKRSILFFIVVILGMSTIQGAAFGRGFGGFGGFHGGGGFGGFHASGFGGGRFLALSMPAGSVVTADTMAVTSMRVVIVRADSTRAEPEPADTEATAGIALAVWMRADTMAGPVARVVGAARRIAAN